MLSALGLSRGYNPEDQQLPSTWGEEWPCGTPVNATTRTSSCVTPHRTPGYAVVQDPKEYGPFLDTLERLEPAERRFQIDCALKRWPQVRTSTVGGGVEEQLDLKRHALCQ